MAKPEYDLTIDPMSLDTEWISQPDFYHSCAVKAANAELELDDAKNNMKVVKAELYLDIANNPGKYGLVKTTEAAIDSVILLCDVYKDAAESVNAAKHKASLCDALVQACDQRKRALENLVSLQLSNYYSTPKAHTAESREVVDNIEKQSIRRKGIRKQEQE